MATHDSCSSRSSTKNDDANRSRTRGGLCNDDKSCLKLSCYISNIQGKGGRNGTKIPGLLARTHEFDFVVLNETNTRVDMTVIIVLNPDILVGYNEN